MEEISTAFDCFKSITKHPETFLTQQNEKRERIQKEMIEIIYKCSKKLASDKKSKALKKIITNGMDSESIWQQLELQNEESFESNLQDVSQFLAMDSQKFQLNLDEETPESDDQKDESEEELNQNENGEASESDSQNNENGFLNNEDDVDDDEEEESDDMPVQKKKVKKSIVDDKFFKLSEMEEFLIDQDRKEMGQSKSDDDIDYFAPDNDEINLQESLKYSDFFDPVHDDQNESDEQSESEEEQENEGPKSSYEIRQERLKKKIQKMEENMLEEKSWQMKGEVKATSRPQNSLLEEILEFDSTTRPAPIITEKVSVQLEDIIKQRIKDKAFDDVERKIKPSDIQYEYKKQLVLNQEKSKQSLSQIYEKEYLKEIEKNNPNAEDVEEEEPKEHKEIRAELKDLFEKLDMLSNFHYTPRPAQPELKIITNLPTIAIEEVAPVNVGNATMLAPEEIKSKPRGGTIIGVNERTKTDKNRDRRHKKAFQRDKFSKQSHKNEGIVNKVMKSRNVEKMKISKEATKSLASSFFNKLQDEIDVSKNGKMKGNKRKAEKQSHEAKKLKL
ncbi:hypothetical protein PVAND_014125 [Polypedilum vanderplanki]|uniref:U3 small nucleolar ribonucleoprotein protein MPP10 n=1 Tax=Polypedilum vanderplanki TaxID=319348 RepID=A0A9J6CS86_POLVA|nr:hypothetical protein PVAND_014125 [Polypedilum vanderplanki]